MLLLNPNPLSSRRLSQNLKIKIYKSILPIVLYDCEAWSLTFREERRLRVFENRILSANIWAQEGCEWGVENPPQ